MKKSNVKVTRSVQEKQATKKARRVRRKAKLDKLVDSRVRVLAKKLIEMDAGFKQMQGLFLNASMELNKLKADKMAEFIVNEETKKPE